MRKGGRSRPLSAVFSTGPDPGVFIVRKRFDVVKIEHIWKNSAALSRELYLIDRPVSNKQRAGLGV